MVEKQQKTDDQNETREKIKVAASKLFAHKGFDGASMRKIATDAGVSLASINYHFRSKQDLYNEILTSSHTNFAQIIEHTLNETDSFVEAVDKIYTIALSNADQMRNNHSMLTNPTAFDEKSLSEMKKIFTTPPGFKILFNKVTSEIGKQDRPDITFWIVNNAILYVYNWIIWTHKDSLAGHIHSQNKVSDQQIRLMIKMHCEALISHCKNSENLPTLVDVPLPHKT